MSILRAFKSKSLKTLSILGNVSKCSSLKGKRRKHKEISSVKTTRRTETCNTTYPEGKVNENTASG